MTPKIGLQFENAKLRQKLETQLKSLDLLPVPLAKSKKNGESVHLYISDQLEASDQPTFSSIPMILIDKDYDFDQLNASINKGRDIVWFAEPPDLDTLTEIIKNILEDSIWTQQSILLSREINLKNRQLEQMNVELENLVEQRTSSIAEEKKEAELKQKKIRKLVSFVQNLSEAETLSDYLESIRKEFRSNFAVSDVFMTSKAKMPENDKDLRLTLANKYSRPIGRIIPILLHNRLSKLENHTYLLIEHAMEDVTVREFMDFSSERLQIMGLALERILLFDELTKSSLDWENTFDTLNDAVGIVDIDYRLLRSNRVFGNSPYQSKCHKIFANSDQVCVGCPVPAAAESGSFQTGEVRKNGRYFRVHSYPIRMEQDTSVTTVVNHYVDITEDRNLYSRVVQHEKMMALGIMAGHIAHELNNPLTGIRSLCQVLGVDASLAENMRNDLKEIENASERCQIIIRNLLEFTLQRDEDGVQPTSLNEVVKKTLPMLKTAMRFHSNEILLEEDEELINANPHLLQQVVFNLVNNSCQAMTTPGQVTIETKKTEEFMKIRISDTGPGISPDNLPRLFEAFFTTKAKGEGTGLGLSISRSVVEKFGGTIELSNTGPSGSSFEVSFPWKKV